MPAPGYDWTCVNCGNKNGAENKSCKACTLPARFTARELAQLKPKELPDDRAHDAKGLGLFVTFFPEGFIALFCLICAPVWSIDLMQKGRIVAGMGLLLAAAAAIGAVYVAVVEKQTWIAYAAVLGYMFCVVSIMK